MTTALLGAMATPEVSARADTSILAVPLGACEQHGPHLPLWTDSLVATALCAALATTRHDVLVAPLVGVGASGEHEGFAGTLSVGTDFLASYLSELVRSSRAWVRGVVMVCGHGGNLDALRLVERTAGHEGDTVVSFLPRVEGGDAHAGRTETSLLLALDADQVRHNEVVTGTTTPLGELEPLLREHGVAAVSSTGVLGDPTLATAEEGRRTFGALAAALVEQVFATFGAPQ